MLSVLYFNWGLGTAQVERMGGVEGAAFSSLLRAAESQQQQQQQQQQQRAADDHQASPPHIPLTGKHKTATPSVFPHSEARSVSGFRV